MMPTTSYAPSSSGIVRPMIPGSAPKRRCQSASLKTATRWRPSTSFSAVKPRPIAGRMRRTSKKFAVTRSADELLGLGAGQPKRGRGVPDGRHRFEHLLLEQSSRDSSAAARPEWPADRRCPGAWRVRWVRFPAPKAPRSPTATSRSCSSNGSPRRTTASTTEKIAVVAPMPSVSTRSATSVNPGVARSARTASRRSVMTPPRRNPRPTGAAGSAQCACRSGARYRARTSVPRNSASASRSATSGSAPPATSSRQRSSRCCDSSSTISASRAGASRTATKRLRISGAQSGMFASGDAPDRLDERVPRLSLLREHAPPLRRDLVEPPAARRPASRPTFLESRRAPPGGRARGRASRCGT